MAKTVIFLSRNDSMFHGSSIPFPFSGRPFQLHYSLQSYSSRRLYGPKVLLSNEFSATSMRLAAESIKSSVQTNGSWMGLQFRTQ
jgi:hypothetical protein